MPSPAFVFPSFKDKTTKFNIILINHPGRDSPPTASVFPIFTVNDILCQPKDGQKRFLLVSAIDPEDRSFAAHKQLELGRLGKAGQSLGQRWNLVRLATLWKGEN